MTEQFRIISPDGIVTEVDDLKISMPSLTEIAESYFNGEFDLRKKFDNEVRVCFEVKLKTHPLFALTMESIFRGSFNKYRHMWE